MTVLSHIITHESTLSARGPSAMSNGTIELALPCNITSHTSLRGFISNRIEILSSTSFMEMRLVFLVGEASMKVL
jgi:hypothetical protein